MAAEKQLEAAEKQRDFYETLFIKILEREGTLQDKQPILETLQKSRANVQRIRELLKTDFTDDNKAELEHNVNIELARIDSLKDQLKENLPEFDVDTYKQWLLDISIILENMKIGLITGYLDAKKQRDFAILFGSTGRSKTGSGKNNLRF